MALEINNIYGVTCVKGKVSHSNTQELKNHFKALISLERHLVINLCEVKKGVKKLTRILDMIKDEISEDQSLDYYSFPEPAVKKLYERINDKANFYQHAA